MNFTLSETEREILNSAMELIFRHTTEDASWLICPAHHKGRGPSVSVTYFTSVSEQLSHLDGPTFADKVQAALDVEAKVPTADELRAYRIASLRKQLAELEGVSA